MSTWLFWRSWFRRIIEPSEKEEAVVQERLHRVLATVRTVQQRATSEYAPGEQRARRGPQLEKRLNRGPRKVRSWMGRE